MYSITDLNGFSKTIREGAAESIAEEYTEDLDEFITIHQIIGLVEEKSLGLDSEGLHIIDENTFDDIFEETRTRIYEAGLAKLAAKGTIECAWDDQTNKMVFWLNSNKKGRVDIPNKPS